MNLIKKLFIYTVILSTVLMGFPLDVAKSANLSAGMLVKRPDMSAVYYLYDDAGTLKRETFPNSGTYFTWFKDFSSVVTITADELGNIPLGKNATYRPGSRLIKITTDPKVYAVEKGGILRWIDSEATAKALYGNNWASLIDDMPDAFFAGNYNSSNAVSNKITTTHPAGTLIKYANSNSIYYVVGNGSKRLVTEAGFTANKFNEDFVIENVADTVSYTNGTDVTAMEADLFPIAEGTAGPAISAGTLGVALASNNPVSTTIITHSTANTYPQALVPFLNVNFTASSAGEVKVTSLKFKRIGIANDGDLGSVYLYDGNTKIAEYSAFNDKVVTFSDSNGLFTVPAGSVRTITLKADLARSNPSVSGSKTIGFEMLDSSYVSSNASSISATYPITGNMMSTAAVNDFGTAYFSGYATYPSTVKADAANQELWRFSITGENQKLQLRYVKLTMIGTIATTDIKNLKLEVGGVQVGQLASIGTDKTVVFDLSSAPYEIPAGQTKIFQLRGDMNGGSGRVFKFTVQRGTDVVLFDTNYNAYLSVAKDAVTTAFGVIQPTTGNGTSIETGTLTMGVDATSPTNYIADGASAVTLGIFSFAAAGEPVKVETLRVKCSSTGSANYIDNLKVLLEGSQVGTTDSTILCDNGTDYTDFTFGSTFVIPAGTTKKLSVVGDTTDTTVAANETLQVHLVAGTGNAIGQTTMTSINTTAQSARLLTVKSGAITVVKNASFGDKTVANPTGVANQADVKIASFSLVAGSGEAVDVTQITLKDDATYPLGNNFQSLYLKNGSTQIGSTIGSLNTTAGTYSFTPSSAMRVAAGAQITVDVYATIKSTVTDSATALTPVLSVDAISATGVNTSSDAGYTTPDVALQTAYIAANGTLTVTTDGDTTLAQQMAMGAVDVELAKFKFLANPSENINVTQIVVSDQTSSAATGTLKNLTLWDGTTKIAGPISVDSTSTSTYANYVFSNLSLVITKNTSKVLTVKADMTTYDEGATSASTHKLAIVRYYDSTNESVTATGAASGTSITGTSKLYFGTSTYVDQAANTMAIYRTLLNFSWSSDTPQGAAVGSDDAIVGKIVATNSANTGSYDATIKLMNFAISQTGISNTADRELKIYKDNTISSGTLVLTTSWLAAGDQDFGNTAITDAGFTDVVIAAGSSKTFIITMDTQDVTSDDKLSISMAADDITWNDGVGDITASNTLPLISKTLSY